MEAVTDDVRSDVIDVVVVNDSVVVTVSLVLPMLDSVAESVINRNVWDRTTFTVGVRINSTVVDTDVREAVAVALTLMVRASRENVMDGDDEISGVADVDALHENVGASLLRLLVNDDVRDDDPDSVGDGVSDLD